MNYNLFAILFTKGRRALCRRFRDTSLRRQCLIQLTMMGGQGVLRFTHRIISHAFPYKTPWLHNRYGHLHKGTFTYFNTASYQSVGAIGISDRLKFCVKYSKLKLPSMYNLIFHALICIYKMNYDKIAEINSYCYNLSNLTNLYKQIRHTRMVTQIRPKRSKSLMATKCLNTLNVAMQH